VNVKARFNGLLKKLQHNDNLKQYRNIITEQVKEEIVEPAQPNVLENTSSHRPVIRETAESTKLRVVYDESAKSNQRVPSLNDCLQVGPPLQPLLHNILVRNRLNPIGLTVDLKQAFHEIWIDEKDRDAFRFFWISDMESKQTVPFQFNRVPFGCASSPFLLCATLQEHLTSLEEQ
jgi:hypothetical protein